MKQRENRRFVMALSLVCCGLGLTGEAQGPAGTSVQSEPSLQLEAAGGRRQATAVRLDDAPNVDGNVLDDAVWTGVPPATGFVQTQPDEGQPATERTEVRIGFTNDTLYVGVVLYDRDPSSIIVTDSRRDSELTNSDSFQFVIDTFFDRQNGFVFGTSPSAHEYDGQLVNEGGGRGNFGFGGQTRGAGGGFNLNWDGVWQVRTEISDIGWSAEFAIPFRTLRFPPGETQTWGVNFQRNIRRRNESAFWAPLPRQFDLFRVSLAGQLAGVEAPDTLWRTLQVTPYVVGEAFRSSGPNRDFTMLGDMGGELKYGVTSGLTLDLTYNTDFAQVEVDDQQINLDRFNLFFPEKRPFFLENAGAFTVSNTGGGFNDTSQTELFFSRRIGIDENGQAIPILGGARLSGKVSNTVTVGFLNMQTESLGSTPSNNFTVARVRQDFANRSSIGGLFVNRQATGSLAGTDNYNRTYAVDGRLGFGQKGTVQGFAAQTETPGRRDQDHAYDLGLDYNSETWQIRGSYMEMGRNFNPEVGFVRRRGFRKVDTGVFYTFRPESFLKLLELRPHATFTRFWNLEDSFIESSLVHIDNGWEFNDGSSMFTAWNIRKEGVVRSFTISGIPVSPGLYDWHEFRTAYNTNRSAPFYAGFSFERSGFFGGDLVSYGPSAGFRTGETFNAEFRWSRNDIDLSNGETVTNLASTRVAYNFSPRVFAQGLVQYNDSADLWSMNLRFGWLQDANTGLFFVYNQTDGLGDFDPTGAGRSLVLKYSYLFDVLGR